MAPKMVFPIVTVTLFGFSGYRIRIKKARTSLLLGFLQSETRYLSLGLIYAMNFPWTYLSDLAAQPNPY